MYACSKQIKKEKTQHTYTMKNMVLKLDYIFFHFKSTYFSLIKSLNIFFIYRMFTTHTSFFLLQKLL